MKNISFDILLAMRRIFISYFLYRPAVISLLFVLLAVINPSVYSMPLSQSVAYDAQSPAYNQQPVAGVPKVITGPASSITHNSATLNGTVNANGLETKAWFQYRVINGLSVNTFSTQSVIGASDTAVSIRVIRLLPGTTYYYRLVAQNNAGIRYGDEMLLTTIDVKPYITTDITPPTGSISINQEAYYTNSFTVTLNLSASDDIGIMGYYLSVNPTVPSVYAPGWISVPPFTAYTEKFTERVPYTLSNGDGRITLYVWYKDAAGNVSDKDSDSIILDTTPPSITITSPTPDPAYITTSNAISISGSASDSTSGVNSVIWSSKEGSRTESEVVDWTTSEIPLSGGDNIITIKVSDGAGNTETHMITVTSHPDTIPIVVTGPATNVTTYLATLHGVVNTKGLPTTAWFQYGTKSGSYNNTSLVQNIEGGADDALVNVRISGLKAGKAYYYRIVAQNSAGTAYGSEMLCNTVSPKGKIYGRATHFASDKPVKFARVRLKGTYAKRRTFKTISTDEDGFFRFKDLDADRYSISVTKKGFVSTTQMVELKEGVKKRLDITLRVR